MQIVYDCMKVQAQILGEKYILKLCHKCEKESN